MATPLSAVQYESSGMQVKDFPSQEIRIMMVTTSDLTLSAFFGQQLRFLAAQGFEVLAVCSPGPWLERIGAGGISIQALPMERKPHPGRDLASLFALRKLISKFRPHILHAHTPKAGLLGMLAASLAGVPVKLYTIHGLPLLTRTGWLHRLLKFTERVSCALSTRTYCISPSLESVVRQMRLCRNAKVSVLGDGSCSGVDLEKFDPQLYGPEICDRLRQTYKIPADARLLCYAGRVAKDKGIEVLAAAWNEVSEHFPDLHLLICGAYDATDPVPHWALEDLRQHPRVRLTEDWVRDMPAVYAASDICVLPTFREGLSQVALECGAMQVPIVGTRIPGLVNAVQDGVSGLLVAPGDAPAFAAAITRLLRDHVFRRRLGLAGRQFVAQHFSQTRVNSLYLDEYRRLAAPFLLHNLTTTAQGNSR